jgi:hypothetical protein
MRNVVFGEKQLESTRKGDHASWMMANMGLRESGWRSRNGMEGGRDPGRFIGLGCMRWAPGGGCNDAWRWLE